ncbi:MAG: SixA phosphatase family protein [Acidimicrobiales bacterium]
MTLYLVRHGDAGDRDEWAGPDHLRPLDEIGWKQAEQLPDLLADKGMQRVISSPYTRCVQTVEPLAEQLGLRVEESDALAEGAGADDTVALVRSLAGITTVLCTHGDNIPRLLERLEQLDGLPLPDDYPYDKGSTWVLEADGSGRFVRAEHVPPPA